MKKLFLCLFVLLTVTYLSVAMAAEPGTEQNPFKTRGPMGKWVANKFWVMRATNLQYVENLEQLEKLPWTKRYTPKTKASLTAFLKGQFDAELKLALVTVEIKNIGSEKREVGCDRPLWVVRMDDGQQSEFGAGNGGGGSKNLYGFAASAKAMRDISFCLKGGMPQLDNVNPRGKTGGVMAFLLPSYAEAKVLFFNIPGHNGGEWEAKESLVLLLKK